MHGQGSVYNENWGGFLTMTPGNTRVGGGLPFPFAPCTAIRKIYNCEADIDENARLCFLIGVLNLIIKRRRSIPGTAKITTTVVVWIE